MSTLDDRLRDVLHDDSFDLGGWDDPVRRVSRGIQRRRRTRLTVGFASAALLVAAPALLWPRPQAGIDSPIAFAEASVGRPAILAMSAPRPEAASCAMAQLAPEAVLDGATVTIRNNGSSPCTLRDPSYLRDLDGRTFREVAEPPGPRQTPATIDPGESARLDILAGTGCGQRYRDLTLVVSGRDYPVALETDCPPRVSAWYVEPRPIDAPLRLSLQLPESVRAGEAFGFVVTLLHTMPRPLQPVDCPFFLLRLGAEAVWRRLNCDPAGDIPADTPVRFAMRAQAPAVAGDTVLSLSWTAVMPDGSLATTGPVTLPLTGGR